MAILDAILDQKVDALIELTLEAATVDDAGSAFRCLLLGVMELRAGDRGLDAVLAEPGRRDRFALALEEAFIPLAETIVEQAIAAGELREGFRAQEICLLGRMVGSIADLTRTTVPDTWRRYALMLVDGTRPVTGAPPLTPPALSFADAMTALGHAG